VTPRAIVLSTAALAYSVFIARTAFPVGGRTHFTLFDDAMISMQYARHLADGYGLRWNPGEPAVEGFSNLLWTLVMAGFHRLPLPDAWMAVPPMLTSLGVMLAIVAVSGRLATLLAGDHGTRAGLYAAILTAACYPLVYWTLRGMEVGLVALLTLVLLWAFLDAGAPPARRWTAAILSTVALTLTRDDGIVPIVAMCGAGLLVGNARDARRLALACVAALVAAKAAHLGWRVSYYGDWVPNTYYLKLTGVPAPARVMAGAAAWLSVGVRQIGPLEVLALYAFRERSGWPIDRRLLIVIAPFAASSAYSIAVGGDAWEYFNFANRYLAAALPSVCILAAVTLHRMHHVDGAAAGVAATLLAGIGVVMMAGGAWDIAEKVGLTYVETPQLVWGVGMLLGGGLLAAGSRRLPRRALTAVAILALAATVSNGRPWARWLVSNAHAMENDRAVSALGVAIRDTTQPGASVAAYLAGSTPYFARRRSIDLFGKSDPHVARLQVTSVHPGHNKVDLPYSLGLRPDVVVTLAEAPEETRRQLAERGYVRLCAALWARSDSALVDRALLAARCQ
jgi:hypothetical protein